MKHGGDGSLSGNGTPAPQTVPVCPECHHVAIENGECHYPDCRFFPLDDDICHPEDDAEIYAMVFSGSHPSANTAN